MDTKDYTLAEYSRMYAENLTLKTCLLQAQNACLELTEKITDLEQKLSESELSEAINLLHFLNDKEKMSGNKYYEVDEFLARHPVPP